jgi:fructose-bisphosphate aldolase class II
MVFGSALREAVARDPDRFDRIEILRDTEAAMTSAARAVIRNLGAHGQAGAAG